MEANGKDFVEFWDYAASKGLVKRDWAGTLRSATKQVLASVEPDAWEAMAVDTLDVDAFVQRFERLRMGDLKPDSLAVYGRRFRTALASYLDFLRSPSTWQYGNGKAEVSTSGPAEKRRPKAAPKPERREDNSASLAVNDSGVSMISYPYQLRAGLIVSVTLPTDLTRHETRRLSTFLDSLVLEEQLALPVGRDE